MNNITFVTHPSVRIKGTENNYNPVQCYDQMCPNKTPHMHCPFCVNLDVYQDPVILKAHYRVKHVDKGIDFAGLKILRCCDHCDIVGIIKGEKKFKGAHWHCYKCRNGFNRRDEAIKHYKTHFRNPQTTFQIQIAQEVNGPSQVYADSNTATVDQSGISIHPALTEAVMSTSLAEEAALIGQNNQVTVTNGKIPEGSVHVSVAANETVDTSDGQTHHIMIIQEEPLETDNNSYTTQIITSDDVRMAEEKEQSNEQNIQNKYEELQQKYQLLEKEKINNEKFLKSQIENLKVQVQTLNNDIVLYQKREQELLEQVSVPLDRNIESLLKHLETQHRDLLHQQLLVIKREYKPENIVSSTKRHDDNMPVILECNNTLPTCEEQKSNEQQEEIENVTQQTEEQGDFEEVSMSDKVNNIISENGSEENSSDQRQGLNIDNEEYTYQITEAGDTSQEETNPSKNDSLVVCIDYSATDMEKTLVENVFTIKEHPVVMAGAEDEEPVAKRQKQNL